MACSALKGSTGGWLHIHGNVATYRARSTGGDEATCTMSRGSGERRHGGGERNPWEMTEGRDPCCDSDDLSVGM